MDEYVPDGFDSLTNGDRRLIREFTLQEPTPTKRTCVYGIVDQQTDGVLYIGQTRALMRRISDHFRTRSGSNLLHLFERLAECRGCGDRIKIEGVSYARHLDEFSSTLPAVAPRGLDIRFAVCAVRHSAGGGAASDINTIRHRPGADVEHARRLPAEYT